MAFRIDYAPEALTDLSRIYDHLRQSYLRFSDTTAEATVKAEARIARILDQPRLLQSFPERGSRHDGIRPGLRHLRIGRTAFWFIVRADLHMIEILAISEGTEDHLRHIAGRLR